MGFSLLESRSIETAVGPVSYRHAAPEADGDDSPIILLHGLGGSSVVWARNIPALAQQYGVYALDLWSGGGSQKPTPEAGAGFLRAFMDAHGMGEAHLVGSSLGGLIAGHFAIADRSRVRSLTLVGSAGLGREIAWSQRLLTLPGVGEFFFRPTERRVRSMLKLLIKQGDRPEALVQALYEDSVKPGATAKMLAALRAGVNLRGVKKNIQFQEELREFALPTLVAAGSRDPLFPLAHAKRLTLEMPSAQLCVFEGSGHWPYFEDSDAFNRELLEFLRST
jgi:pimeloyl-ACP methyl ester carboxylesterase